MSGLLRLGYRQRIGLLAGLAVVLGLAVVARTVGQGVGARESEPPEARHETPAEGLQGDTGSDSRGDEGEIAFDEGELGRARAEVAWIARRRPFSEVSFETVAARPAAASRPVSSAPAAAPVRWSTPSVELRFTGVVRGPGGYSVVFEDRGRGKFMLLKDGDRLGDATLAVGSSATVSLAEEGGARSLSVGDRVSVPASGNLEGWGSSVSSPASSGASVDGPPAATPSDSGAGGVDSGNDGGDAGSSASDPAADEALRRRMEELRERRRASLDRNRR